jgi:hypothetical protein
MNNSRFRFYALNDQPLSQLLVDGLMPTASSQNFGDGDPSDTLAWSSSIVSTTSSSSPITLNIEQVKNGSQFSFKVLVSSSTQLQGQKLRFVIAEYYRRSSTVGTNGQLDFRYIAREMINESGLADSNGIELNIDPGVNKEYTFTYTPSISGPKALNPEFLYGVAFIQDDESKEVLQVESSAKPEILAAVNSSQPLYFKAGPGEVVNKEVSVVTNMDVETLVSVYVDTVGNPIPAGWSVTIEPNEITKIPDEEAIVTVNVTVGDQAAYYVPTIAAKTKVDNSFNIPLSRSIVGILSYNTKNLVSGFSSFAAKGVYTKGIASNILSKTSVMPWISELFSEFSDIVDESDLLIVPMATQPLYLDPQFQFANPVEQISNFIDQGKKILIFSNLALSWAFNENFPENQFAGVGNGPLVQEFFDKIGIELGSNAERVSNQGGGISLTPFTIRGVTNNVIGNKLNNGAAVRANAFTPANFFAGSYVTSTDVIKVTNPNIATPFMYYDTDQTSIAATHSTIGNSRVVYVTFPLEILDVASNQQEILRKCVNWLLTGSAASVDDELMESANKSLSVSMNPNPVQDRAVISYVVKGNTPTYVTISLYDTMGNEVATISQGIMDPGSHTVNLSTNGFATGAYRLVVRSLDGSGVHLPVHIVR